MVKINEGLKEAQSRYIELHRRLEMIDSAILENLNPQYNYYDNEAPFHIKSGIDIPKETFSADLVYISKDFRKVILVEETLDITSENKENQLVAYGNISSQSLQAITKSDVVPSVDTMVVFPINQRDEALILFSKISSQINGLGRNRGVTFWGYPVDRKSLNCIGGQFSSSFPNDIVKLQTHGIGRARIFKKADPISILQYMVSRAIESEYGIAKDGIEFNREKLLKWFEPSRILDEGRWKNAIKIGKNVGWLTSVSLEQLTGIIKHTKMHPSSIRRSKNLSSHFFEAIEEPEDEIQSSLNGFK